MKRKTIAAFEEWKADPRSWSELLQRVAEGETLPEVCKSKGLAYSLIAKHIAETPLLKAEYDAALQIWGDALAQETVKIADDATPETIGPAKLQVDTRLKVAGKLDRERYGERERPAVAVNISLGDVAREIRELETRLGIGLPSVTVVEQLPAPAEKPEELERI